MKVVVYAICKNEEQFVDRWMDSMGEADQVAVLDTGSTDGTVRCLRDPWGLHRPQDQDSPGDQLGRWDPSPAMGSSRAAA